MQPGHTFLQRANEDKVPFIVWEGSGHTGNIYRIAGEMETFCGAIGMRWEEMLGSIQ